MFYTIQVDQAKQSYLPFQDDCLRPLRPHILTLDLVPGASSGMLTIVKEQMIQDVCVRVGYLPCSLVNEISFAGPNRIVFRSDSSRGRLSVINANHSKLCRSLELFYITVEPVLNLPKPSKRSQSFDPRVIRRKLSNLYSQSSSCSRCALLRQRSSVCLSVFSMTLFPFRQHGSASCSRRHVVFSLSNHQHCCSLLWLIPSPSTSLLLQPIGINIFTMIFNKLTLLAVFGMAAASEALLTNPIKTSQKVPNPV